MAAAGRRPVRLMPPSIRFTVSPLPVNSIEAQHTEIFREAAKEPVRPAIG